MGKSLISVRSNIIYTKHGDEYMKFHELVFVVDESKYKRTNEGEIIREREVSDVRFTISDSKFDALIGLLEHLKNAKEEDLK